MHCPVHVKHSRNILCIFPAYAPSFGTFSHAFALVPGVRAFMPPQGLLIVAAYVILRAFRPPLASLLAGFFSVVAAVLVEMVGQLLRRSPPPDASS